MPAVRQQVAAYPGEEKRTQRYDAVDVMTDTSSALLKVKVFLHRPKCWLAECEL
jgi:hypothetical protein